MQFVSLRLHNVRSYQGYTTSLSPGVTVIVGANASGKTNLLEAVYVLAHGTSFRARDRDVMRDGTDSAQLKAHLSNGTERLLHMQITDDDRLSKQFTINGTKRSRLSFGQRLPVVLFDPDSLRALSSSPSRRRLFLDTILTRLQPQFGTQLRRYERALLQRNDLLKKRDRMSSQ